jgi:NAD-dependent dihydropyrimidine dehydrogenase PreA subunit
VSIMPIIDQTRCDGCGLCVTVCKCGALVLSDNIVAILEVDNCGWCTDCELVCATGALQCPFEIVVLES